jgi:hypothetical protein
MQFLHLSVGAQAKVEMRATPGGGVVATVPPERNEQGGEATANQDACSDRLLLRRATGRNGSPWSNGANWTIGGPAVDSMRTMACRDDAVNARPAREPGGR